MKKLIFFAAFLCLVAPVFGQTVVGTSLNAVTATGIGATVAQPGLIHQDLATITFTGAGPTAQTTLIQGSIDNQHWFTVYTSTTTAYTDATASGEAVSVVNYPFLYWRCNLTVYTAGSNTGVTCNIIRVRTN